MALQSKLLLFALLALFSNCFTPTTQALRHNVTRIQFYLHDIAIGQNASAVRVAGPANFSSAPNPFFGSVLVIDDPLTASPDSNSTLVGRAQGFYAFVSQQPNDFTLHMSLTFWFTSGLYNGSTFSVSGRNPVNDAVRELPIVGGTGMFRLARGYCLARTYWFKAPNAIVGYNVTLIHYH